MEIIFFPKQSLEYYRDALTKVMRLGSAPNPCDEAACPLCARAHAEFVDFVQHVIKHHSDNAGVAQSVEQGPRKTQARGSIPLASTRLKETSK